jgi:hypothetical protein
MSGFSRDGLCYTTKAFVAQLWIHPVGLDYSTSGSRQCARTRATLLPFPHQSLCSPNFTDRMCKAVDVQMGERTRNWAYEFVLGISCG